MNKVVIVILASTETHKGLGRAVNAFQVARELKSAGDEVKVIFDGAGTVAAATLSDPAHRSHRLFSLVQDRIVGACSFCASAFEVKEQVEPAGIQLLDEFNGHPSLRTELANGYQILTF